MRRLVSVLAATAALAACASPDAKLYTLLATSPAASPNPLPTPAPVVELRHVEIPGYLDRPEVVRSQSDYRVHLLHNDRWSEPFADLLQRVMADDLTRRLPGGLTYSDDGAITAKPTRIVEIDIGRLDADGTGDVVLDAQFSLRGPDETDPATTRAVHLTVPEPAPDTSGYAAAISTAAGQLADVVAGAVREQQAIPAS